MAGTSIIDSPFRIACIAGYVATTDFPRVEHALIDHV